jgi:hypothetical protein
MDISQLIQGWVDNRINNQQAVVNTQQRQESNKTFTDRNIVTTEAGVLGGSGDSDIRKFLTPILSNHVPITQGVNGLQCGFVAFNMDKNKVFEQEQPLVFRKTGPSDWNGQAIDFGYYRENQTCEYTDIPGGELINLSGFPGDGEANLNWNQLDYKDKKNGAEAYEVKRSLVEGGPYKLIKTVPVDTLHSWNNYRDTGLINGNIYYYVINPINCKGKSDKTSNEIAIQPRENPPDPEKPPDPGTICVYRWIYQGCDNWSYIVLNHWYESLFNGTTDRYCANGPGTHPYPDSHQIYRWVFNYSPTPYFYNQWAYITVFRGSEEVVTSYDREACPAVLGPYPPNYSDPNWNGT